MKDGSFFVVTPSSIPSSTTLGPNANLSSEGSNKVLEDSDDKPTMKKRISDSKEEESAKHRPNSWVCLFMLLSFLLPPFFFCHLLFIQMYLCHPFAAVSLHFACPFL